MANKLENNEKPASSFNFKPIFMLSVIILSIAYLFLVLYPSKIELFQKEITTMATSDESWKNAQSIYEFKATDIDGNLVEMSKYKYFKYNLKFIFIYKYTVYFNDNKEVGFY